MRLVRVSVMHSRKYKLTGNTVLGSDNDIFLEVTTSQVKVRGDKYGSLVDLGTDNSVRPRR